VRCRQLEDVGNTTNLRRKRNGYSRDHRTLEENGKYGCEPKDVLSIARQEQGKPRNYEEDVSVETECDMFEADWCKGGDDGLVAR